MNNSRAVWVVHAPAQDHGRRVVSWTGFSLLQEQCQLEHVIVQELPRGDFAIGHLASCEAARNDEDDTLGPSVVSHARPTAGRLLRTYKIAIS